MAKLIADEKVRMGAAIAVENQSRRPHENADYLALKVEDFDGGNERWLLFTRKELASRPAFSVSGVTDKWKMGRLYEVAIGRRKRYAVRFWHGEWQTYTLLLSDSAIRTAEARAKRNPEDVPKQGMLGDLFD